MILLFIINDLNLLIFAFVLSFDVNLPSLLLIGKREKEGIEERGVEKETNFRQKQLDGRGVGGREAKTMRRSLPLHPAPLSRSERERRKHWRRKGDYRVGGYAQTGLFNDRIGLGESIFSIAPSKPY